MESNKSTTIGQNEYKVESILDKITIPCNGVCDGIIGCKCNGRVEYKIKWLGYGPECNSWEPLKHLYCDDLIEQFEQNFNKKKLEKGQKNDVSKPGLRVRRLEKRKYSSEKLILDEPYSGKHPAKCRKKETPLVTSSKQETSNNTVSAKKSVGFLHPATRKIEASEKRDKKQYKRRSDAAPQINPDLEPETIVGAADSGGELMFLIKWKGTEKVDLIPAREANVRFTDMVVKFYEERIQWHAGYLLSSNT